MVCVSVYMNHLSNEILCASQLGLNVSDAFIEYNMSVFDILITCHGKDNMDLEKLKGKDNFLLFGWGEGEKVSTCCK